MYCDIKKRSVPRTIVHCANEDTVSGRFGICASSIDLSRKFGLAVQYGFPAPAFACSVVSRANTFSFTLTYIYSNPLILCLSGSSLEGVSLHVGNRRSVRPFSTRR